MTRTPVLDLRRPTGVSDPTVVELWSAWLDLGTRELARLAGSLSGDELRQASRFAYSRERARFVAARGTVREILGSVLGRDPCDVRFGHSVHGKPHLAEDTNLRFTVSHSADLLVCAVRRARELGVDVERVRTDCWSPSLTESAFTREELRDLGAEIEQLFRAWTRKEAYLKGKGLGLQTALRDVSITRCPDGSWSPRGPETGDGATTWSLRDLTPAPGYVGTIAVEGEGWRLRERWWTAGGSGRPPSHVGRSIQTKVFGA